MMALPLTDADLVVMRADAESLMPDTATITDPGTVSTTASGGLSIASPVVRAGVPCRIVSANYQTVRSLFGEQLAAQIIYTCTLPQGASVSPGWWVDKGGVRFTVIGVVREWDWSTVVRVGLSEGREIGG